jgi:hypothetical protein
MAKLNYEKMRRNSFPSTSQSNDSIGDVPVELNGPDYKLKIGKYRGIRIRYVPLEYLQWAATNMSGSMKSSCAREIERRLTLS